MKRWSVMIAMMLVLQQQMLICRAQLSSHNPYATSCPKALTTIKAAVYSAILKDRGIGASLLRLHFHDCFVNARSLSLSLIAKLIHALTNYIE